MVLGAKGIPDAGGESERRKERVNGEKEPYKARQGKTWKGSKSYETQSYGDALKGLLST